MGVTSARPTLITGATGFAGSHLLDRLAGRGPVVAWRGPTRAAPPPRPGVVWRHVDVRDRQAVADAVAAAQPARVFHVAGASRADTSWQNVVPHLQANVLGTHHVLDAVRVLAEPCKVVVVSSAMVYQVTDRPIDESAPLIPSNPYGLSKLAQDQLALRAAMDDRLDVVVARPFNHAGPRQTPNFAVSSFARQIALIEIGRLPPDIRVGNLDVIRDLTDVRDVVEAYERLMERGASGRAYNICSGTRVRIGDVLDALRRLSGTAIQVIVDPARLRPADVPVFVGDARRLHRETGWAPLHTLEQTLRDTLDWWREQVRNDPHVELGA